ncbi:MAG: NAD(P)-binding domain-containing protein [Saprospiraceae bacterium]|nr:NAD(P)-binding domain-containing protein [Saprospiraceae bacterium]
MEVLIEQIVIYGSVFILCGLIIFFYLRKQNKVTATTTAKIALAKEEGSFEPISLHPYIDLNTCIGSAACISACPEKDILGIVDGKAAAINASSCVGHGACFHTCPVEAISLRIGTETRGVELPHVNQTFETNIKGIFIAGELGGMGLIKNSVEQGKQAVENIIKGLTHKNNSILDLVIIGAGPAGISGALTAKKHGLSFEVLEQDTLGGTVYSFPRAKIVMTNPMDLPLYGKVNLYDTSKDELLQIWNEALSKNDITIRENTKVDNIIPLEDGTFKVMTSSKEALICKHVLIAIGRRGTPRKLGVSGEELPKVFYRLLEPELIQNKHILVVGGGDSAIESAMLLMDENEVTLSYRKDVFARLKPKNKEKIIEAEKANKITIIYNSNLEAIQDNSIRLNVKGEDQIRKMKNDLVYIFAGGELPTNFLSNAGIEVKKRFGYIMKKHGV